MAVAATVVRNSFLDMLQQFNVSVRIADTRAWLVVSVCLDLLSTRVGTLSPVFLHCTAEGGTLFSWVVPCCSVFPNSHKLRVT